MKIWGWRRTEKRSWTDLVRNEVLRRVKEERNILQKEEEARLAVLITSCVGTAF
jgi:hypothetical protein